MLNEYTPWEELGESELEYYKRLYIEEVAMKAERVTSLEEYAWTIIANGSEWDVPDDGTPCGERAREWREAAIRWRDQYHEKLREVRVLEGE